MVYRITERKGVVSVRELCEVVQMGSASAEPTARQALWDSCVARDMKKHLGFILPHGNYRELLSYKKAKVVFDVTFAFCRRFLTRGDRTIDQMVQAARSGKQNILEGSKASGTSKEMEIKLTNTARASLEELLDIAICLIHQTNYLLDQQIRRLERDFINEGGMRERMARVRFQQRRSAKPRGGRKPPAGHRRSDP